MSSDGEDDQMRNLAPTNLEFWSLEIPPGKMVKAKVEEVPGMVELVHITGCALGEGPEAGPHVVKVVPYDLQRKKQPEVALGTLVSGRTDQFAVDFGISSTTAFRHSGKSTVYLTGYRTRSYESQYDSDDEDDDYESDEESDEDSEDEEAPDAVPIAPAVNGIKVGKQQKASAAAAAAAAAAEPDSESEGDEDESSDDDADEDESDEGESDSDEEDEDQPQQGLAAMETGMADEGEDESEEGEDEDEDEDEDESDEGEEESSDEGEEEEESEDEQPTAAAAAAAARPTPGKRPAQPLTPQPQSQQAKRQKAGVPQSEPAKPTQARTAALAAAGGGSEQQFLQSLVAELRKGGSLTVGELSNKVKKPADIAGKYKAFLTKHSDSFVVDGDKVSLKA